MLAIEMRQRDAMARIRGSGIYVGPVDPDR
jgi:hypothetical protein